MNNVNDKYESQQIFAFSTSLICCSITLFHLLLIQDKSLIISSNTDTFPILEVKPALTST